VIFKLRINIESTGCEVFEVSGVLLGIGKSLDVGTALAVGRCAVGARFQTWNQ